LNLLTNLWAAVINLLADVHSLETDVTSTQIRLTISEVVASNSTPDLRPLTGWPHCLSCGAAHSRGNE